MRVITYDLETLHTIEEAGGWDRHDRLGVSILCAHDSEVDRVYCFSDELPEPWRSRYHAEPLAAFRTWSAIGDRLVGFNNLRFDNEVLRWNGGAPPVHRCYDILIESWKAQGLPLDRYDKATHSGGLQDYAVANLGTGKSGSGELAPKLWAKGEYAVVIEYCCLDVRLTKSLYDLIESRGWLDNPKTGKRVQFPSLRREVVDA